jgi:hypothetical protein
MKRSNQHSLGAEANCSFRRPAETSGKVGDRPVYAPSSLRLRQSPFFAGALGFRSSDGETMVKYGS